MEETAEKRKTNKKRKKKTWHIQKCVLKHMGDSEILLHMEQKETSIFVN